SALFVHRQPLVVNARRNFGRLDLAASTPEHVCVRNGDIARAEMLINRRLVIQEQSLIRTVRHGHDVDVLKFRAGFAPVAMGENVMTADLPSRYNFAGWR